MSSSYSENLRLTEQGVNDNPNTWGNIVNQQVISLLEQAIAEVATIDCTGSSDVNIANTVQNGASDDARHAVLELTGVIGANINLIVPAVQKTYIINAKQTGGYTINIYPDGGVAGNGVTLTTSQKAILYTNGTVITAVVITGDSAGTALLAANNLSDLTNTATARTNLGLGTMAVQNANAVNITGGTITGVTGLSAVTSVAGRTGAITLTASDIGGLGALALLNSVTGATGGVTATTGKLVMGAITIQYGQTAETSDPSVTFPTAYSSGAPLVLVGVQKSNSISYSANVHGTPTTTGFDTHTFSTATGNTVPAFVNWISFGVT